MEKAGLPQTEGLKTVVIHGRPYPLRFAEEPKKIRFIDLFCGIGGFRIAAESLGWEGVFSCDIDREAKKTYFVNFGEYPHHDIKDIDEICVPDHEILLAGFPCQPFSIIGDRKGLNDTRGTLFFDIARILKEKKPQAFVLENVKQLVGHNGGKTFQRMIEVLRDSSYFVDYKVLNALNFGLPQKRERVFIVGTRNPLVFEWPKGDIPMKPLFEILEKNVEKKYYATEYIQKKRSAKHRPKYTPSIWHENKGGNVSSYPYSCALRAGASYNYLLVNGTRRLTPREMLRLQGFPDSLQIVCDDSEVRKQAGNAVPVPVVQAVLRKLQEVWPLVGKTTTFDNNHNGSFKKTKKQIA